jgi:hypothetical protein
MFNTALTKIASCSYPDLDQPSLRPHTFTLISTLILSSRLRLVIQSDFSLRSPHRNHVCTSPLPHPCYMLCTSSYSWFDFRNCIFPFVRRYVLTVFAPRPTPKMEDHSHTELIIIKYLVFCLVHVRALVSLLHITTRLMHKSIINTVSLRHVSALKGLFSGSTTDIFQQQSTKWVTRYKIQFNEHRIMYYATDPCTCRVIVTRCSLNWILRLVHTILLTSLLKFICCTPWRWGARGGAVVETLRYKPEGRGIDSRWCHFIDIIFPTALILTEMSTRNISWG